MNRRTFLKKLGLSTAALTLTGCNRPFQKASGDAHKKPNIIYIIADDLGYGDLGCYGQKIVKTPNIDRICAEGMKFTQHYAGSTVCAPSRCVLMTGLHTGHCQVRGNREVKPEGQAPMKPGTVTITTLLNKAGYTSGMFGKWGLGAPGSASDPTVYFDRFYGYNCQRQAHTFYPTHLWNNDKKVGLDGKTYSHDLIMNKAVEFIKTNRNKTFFCYMPVTIPHAAMHAPKKLHDKYRKLFPQFESKIGKYAKTNTKNPIAAFAAMIEHLDNGIGKLMSTLRQLGIDDNTIVMFTSDNGPHLEGGHDPKFFDSNGPLKGFKRDLYEGGIRVPMIARWPGRIEPNTQTDHISAFWDVLPTICEIANIEPPKNIDGISFVPAMLGKKQKKHKYLYWEFHKKGGKQALRMGKWKAVRLGASSNPNAPLELYDINTDIGEKNNIAANHPDIIAKINNIMDQARTHSDKWPFYKKEKA